MFTALVSVLFLGEGVGVVKAVSIIICISGVFCITQPDFIFENYQLNLPGGADVTYRKQNDTRFSQKESDGVFALNKTVGNLTGHNPPGNDVMNGIKARNDITTGNVAQSRKTKQMTYDYIGYILVTVTGFSTSLTCLFIRGSRVTELTWVIQIIWTLCISLLISVIPMLIFETPTVPKDLMSSLFLTGHIAFSFLATVSYYMAVNVASGVLVSLSYSSGVLFSMLAQYFIVNNIKPGHRNLLEISGAVLVLFASCMNPVYQLITERLETNVKKEMHEEK